MWEENFQKRRAQVEELAKIIQLAKIIPDDEKKVFRYVERRGKYFNLVLDYRYETALQIFQQSICPFNNGSYRAPRVVRQRDERLSAVDTLRREVPKKIKDCHYFYGERGR